MGPKLQYAEPPTSDIDKAKKKSGGPVQIFKVMLRRRSMKSKSSVDVTSTNKSMWRRLLGSMRPLHAQRNESPPNEADQVDKSLAPSRPKEEIDQESSPMPLFSPSSPFSCASSSSSFGTSQYASAANLKELDDNSDSGDDGNAIFDEDEGGDEMIDEKAEEFIAQFYEQMRRQRHNN